MRSEGLLLSVDLSVCPSVGRQTWICGYVQPALGTARVWSGVVQEQHVYIRRGPKIIYSYYTRCALIKDHRPTAWDGFGVSGK